MRPNAGSHGVVVTDASGRITMLNDAAKVLLGIEYRHVIGRVIKEIIPDSRLTDVLWVERVTKEESLNILGHPLVISRTPVYENSQLIGSIFILQDISEHEQVKKDLLKLREDKHELEAMFNSSFDEMLVINKKGSVIKINKTGETCYGIGVGQLVGKNIIELEKQGYWLPPVFGGVFEKKERVTAIQKTSGGKELIVTANPVLDKQGNVIRVVVNVRDFSELSRLRQHFLGTEQIVESSRKQVRQLDSHHQVEKEIIAYSKEMVTILEMVNKVARVESTILITGESGVGKGVIAYKIHKLSARSQGPFVSINCGAIPENLLESELFGYAPGAFTGAQKSGKKGLIQMGDHGTVFLDEVAELPLNLQVKLLHALQQKSVMLVGGTAPIDVEVRFIAATNRNIKLMLHEGSFREDLYYRLNVIPIEIPPLRKRREDILPLVEYYLGVVNKKYKVTKKLAPETRDILQRYSWPGNVREVENIVERIVVTSNTVEIKPMHLPDYVLAQSTTPKDSPIYVSNLCSLEQAVQEVEKQLIARAYDTYANTYQMAEALGVNQSTVVRKIKKYLSLPRRKPGPKGSGLPK